MSWDHNPDHFASSSSSSHPTRSVPPPPPLPASSRNNLRGQSAHVRHLANLAVYDRDGSKAREKEKRMREEGKTDWDVLREEHRFIRDDDNEEPSSSSYGEAIARKLESQMFKEYALIDLKHYKSGKIALRWRTPQEVISSLGSSTCGSLRCPFHNPPTDDAPRPPPLQTFELPFAYIENNEPKSALVKVVLCDPRCRKKLFWGKEGGGGGEKERASRDRSASPPRERSRRKEGRSRSRSPERRQRKETETRR